MAHLQRKSNGTRKLGALALAAAIALGTAPVWAGAPTASAAAAETYKVISQPFVIEGSAVAIPAINVDGSTYVALRYLNAQLGLTTGWDQASRTATAAGTRGRELKMNLKTGESWLNKQQIYGESAILQNGTTYLPFRFLLENMGYSVGYDAATKVIKVDKIQENDLTYTTNTIAERDDKRALKLEVNYPQLSGMANADAQAKINAYLKSEAESHAKDGKAELDVAAQDNADLAKDDPSRGQYPVEFDGIYKVTYNENNEFSLYVDYYIYTGGAHGSTVREAYNFDLATGELITLRQAADGNPKYVDIINAEIKKQIKTKELEPLLVPFETIEPDRPYYMSRNGLVVFFQQYEYVPYAAGMPEFVIPLSDFK